MSTNSNSGNNGTPIVWNGILSGGNITTYVPQWITVPIPIPVPAGAVSATEKKKDSDGCTCKKCKEFFEFAEPNQEDGTLVCWSCRHGW